MGKNGAVCDGNEGVAILSSRTFDRIRKLVYETAGIDLRPGKETLVSSRLGKLLRLNGLRTYEECIDQVVADRSGESLVALIDALTTNYTSFLREKVHFEYLVKHVLPPFVQRGAVDIWCAAAATGEEPYSLACTILDALGSRAAANSRILATDISTQALSRARSGIYAAERFQALPSDWMSKYLLRGEGDSKGFYKIKPELMRMVDFQRLNLSDAFDPGAIFPVIFCRNVMIYFDKPTQGRIVNRLAKFLSPGGYLFVGLSESLNGIEHPLRYVQPSIYRRAGND